MMLKYKLQRNKILSNTEIENLIEEHIFSIGPFCGIVFKNTLCKQ